ncbi:hypothetical protein F5Y16DRAFT_26030 [Xylariaceae sp. FL0255]|nr:hypothetical protein F5Y16DRAFT_26030 [Xylariaceae sp. FL0255]
MAPAKAACDHESLLQLESSPWAEEAGFERRDIEKRLAAATTSGRNPLADPSKSASALKKLYRDTAEKLSTTFPGPLVLPFDDLNWEPKYLPQSVRSWHAEIHRNRPDAERKTIYVAATPTISLGTGTPELGAMEDWTSPTNAATKELKDLEPPSVDSSIQYLKAFYHGFEVKPLQQNLRFIPWTDDAKRGKRGSPKYCIGLADDNACTRIRTRPAPDQKYKAQLNLFDILDATMEMLPPDAYAVILMVDFDLYGDEEDEFCCGLAYGGSRVCVVSSARYHPALDVEQSIDYGHMWPASHCMKYVDSLCATQGLEPRKYKKPPAKAKKLPLYRAVEASQQVGIPSSSEELRSLWFSRVARTASHEIGHCFGIDHCVYYACNMQGTSGMIEDVRQPPYLCPVCLEKVSHAVVRESQGRDRGCQEAYIKERYTVIADFCSDWKQSGLFAGYGAWIEARLEMM